MINRIKPLFNTFFVGFVLGSFVTTKYFINENLNEIKWKIDNLNNSQYEIIDLGTEDLR